MNTNQVNNNGRKDTAYLVSTEKLSELLARQATSSSQWQILLYNFQNTMLNVTPEQKIRQDSNRWLSNKSDLASLSSDEICKLIRNTLATLIEEKYDGDLEKELRRRVEDSDVKLITVITEFPNGERIPRTNIWLEKPESEYKNSKEELERELSTCKSYVRHSLGTSQPEAAVYLENYEVSISEYNHRQIREKISKMPKRIIKDELPYCLRKGKLSVPKSYLDKGMLGVNEYISVKRKANKNNGMEKRMLRDIVRNKKCRLDAALNKVEARISCVSNRWNIPALDVDGRFNQSKCSALITQLLKDKTQQQLLGSTDEELLKLAKDYWKEQLTLAIQKIDELKLEEVSMPTLSV